MLDFLKMKRVSQPPSIVWFSHFQGAADIKRPDVAALPSNLLWRAGNFRLFRQLSSSVSSTPNQKLRDQME
jgi:hypothetical protein